MIWFFLGFVFGVHIAQESPNFPNIKTNSKRFFDFVLEILNKEKVEEDIKSD
jgi:hypothetical protein